MKERDRIDLILKSILWLVIIGMISCVGWSVIHIYNEIASIHEQTVDYNRMLLESISNTAERQAEKVKSINKK